MNSGGGGRTGKTEPRSEACISARELRMDDWLCLISRTWASKLRIRSRPASPVKVASRFGRSNMHSRPVFRHRRHGGLSAPSHRIFCLRHALQARGTRLRVFTTGFSFLSPLSSPMSCGFFWALWDAECIDVTEERMKRQMEEEEQEVQIQQPRDNLIRLIPNKNKRPLMLNSKQRTKRLKYE